MIESCSSPCMIIFICEERSVCSGRTCMVCCNESRNQTKKGPGKRASRRVKDQRAFAVGIHASRVKRKG